MNNHSLSPLLLTPAEADSKLSPAGRNVPHCSVLTSDNNNIVAWKRVRIISFYSNYNGERIDENPRPQKMMRSNNTHKRKR
jgi:hypothetical protein